MVAILEISDFLQRQHHPELRIETRDTKFVKYIRICLRACVRVCMRACVRAYVRACENIVIKARDHRRFRSECSFDKIS